MHIRARFECKSVKQTLPHGQEKVRYEITLCAKDVCEGDNGNWSPDARPDGMMTLVVTDEKQARQFKPGRYYASCIVGIDHQGTWRQVLDRICNLGKRRQESSSAWSRFIIWLMPVAQFVSYTWIANGLRAL